MIMHTTDMTHIHTSLLSILALVTSPSSHSCNVLGTAMEVGGISNVKLGMGNILISRPYNMAVLKLLSYRLHIVGGAFWAYSG